MARGNINPKVGVPVAPFPPFPRGNFQGMIWLTWVLSKTVVAPLAAFTMACVLFA